MDVEKLILTVGSQNASVTINDTSKTPPPAAQTFTLTTGVDTGAAFTGGDGDDIFIASQTTLTAADYLQGGAGKDTLRFIDALPPTHSAPSDFSAGGEA